MSQGETPGVLDFQFKVLVLRIFSEKRINWGRFLIRRPAPKKISVHFGTLGTFFILKKKSSNRKQLPLSYFCFMRCKCKTSFLSITKEGKKRERKITCRFSFPQLGLLVRLLPGWRQPLENWRLPKSSDADQVQSCSTHFYATLLQSIALL